MSLAKLEPDASHYGRISTVQSLTVQLQSLFLSATQLSDAERKNGFVISYGILSSLHAF